MFVCTYTDTVLSFQVCQMLHDGGFMSEVDTAPGDTMNKKIRNAQLDQFNYILGLIPGSVYDLHSSIYIHLSIHPIIHPFIHPSICPFIHPLVYLTIHLSICSIIHSSFVKSFSYSGRGQRVE